MNYILYGMKSCGKSTLGSALALELGFDFVDTDKIIEFRFNCPYSLREKMIKRLKELNFDRSEVMCEFLEEWLNETQTLVKKTS